MTKYRAEEISIALDKVTLQGLLTVPKDASGIVLFAHGSGSGRFSSRNQFVAQTLIEGGIATLLVDLLTVEEEKIDEHTREYRFDIQLLATRLVDLTLWIKNYVKTKQLKVGYFGASTGAAAALIAGAKIPEHVSVIVSRGGRPDLARDALPLVRTPTLLIVGGDDYDVIQLNQQAYDSLLSFKKLEIIPGATHLFEEEGTLDQVATLALHFFQQFLT